MRKILLLDDFFPTGEQTVQPVLLWGQGRQDFSRLMKTASEALDYIKNVTPEPGKTHLLVIALGGEETYGPNRNGDGFPEHPVPAKSGKGYWVPPGEELTKHYQSFEKNPAHLFKHHQNKDPKTASGQVKRAFWNGRMHRVELLVVLDNAKDPEWVQRVNDGDFPPVSMGCRIKRDVCAICGNEAPTRAQYCDHAKYAMNQLMPDGRKVYVHNPSPNFFDLSRVARPADRTGYTVKKVAEVYELRSSAELGEIADGIDRKSAAIRKLSDIDKIVRAEPVASSSNLAPTEQMLIRHFRDFAEPRVRNAPPLPLDELMKHSAATALSTLSAMGIMLKDAEFLTFMTSKLAGRPMRIPMDLLQKTASLLPHVIALFESSPALCEDVLSTGVLDETQEKISTTLQSTLEPWRIKRAYVGEMLYRRMVPEGSGLRPDAAPTTDMMHWTDPHSGATQTTTRGAAIDAQDAVTKAHLGKMLGGSAMLLGGYKLLSTFPYLRNAKLPLAMGMGALGYGALKQRTGGTIRTDEGYGIPSITEFAPKQASEQIPALVVHLLESHQPIESSLSARATEEMERLKQAAFVDDVRGIMVDLDDAGSTLGRLICS